MPLSHGAVTLAAMRSKIEALKLLEDPGVIAVVRARSREQVLPLAGALVRGGFRAVEITMTTPDAVSAIHETARQLAGEAMVGVGTVLDADNCRRAMDAGAEFVVSPIARPAIALAAQEANRPVMLGAYTPTEAQTVHETGADFVKLFPADCLGPAYIRAIRAPLPHLKLVPTGGVTLENIAEFFRAGCAAVGVGSSLISRQILQAEDWAALEDMARRYIAAARAARLG